MVTLRKITLENRRELFALRVSTEQSRFVAHNVSSIATCYILASNGGHPLPFAIYSDEQMIGFVLIVYGITSYELPNRIAHNNYSIQRFMIGQQYQSQGYGKEAMRKILQYIRTFPVEPAEYCWIAYKQDNLVARNLYRGLGFRENGEVIEGDEVVAILKL